MKKTVLVYGILGGVLIAVLKIVEYEEAIARKKAEMDKFAEFYRNPAINAAITFVEPLPVALIVALVSAGVLSRRRKGVGESGVVSAARVSTTIGAR